MSARTARVPAAYGDAPTRRTTAGARRNHSGAGTGINAGTDLALALDRHDHGADAARAVAREPVVFTQRPGRRSRSSTALATPPARSELLRALTDAVLADPAAGHSPPATAATAAVSTRHPSRLFQSEPNTIPAGPLGRTRPPGPRAPRLLLAGHSVTAADRRSGLGSDETRRRAFARHLGTTPTDFRTRFATTGSPTGSPTGGPTGTPTG
ncbi:hypothetical protein [Kitasatospora sp. NPDC059599]|uniref:hypothetical protein n=1 Tax=Kitasatospora sp. NPDC059599 TaxID=3346880 RepID=UPI003699ED36